MLLFAFLLKSRYLYQSYIFFSLILLQVGFIPVGFIPVVLKLTLALKTPWRVPSYIQREYQKNVE
jgi:hypothetical protein